MRPLLAVAALLSLATAAPAQDTPPPAPAPTAARPAGPTRPRTLPGPVRTGDVVERVVRPRAGGPVQRLVGSIALAGDDAGAQLADFRAGYGSWFGIDAAVRLEPAGEPAAPAGARTLRVAQLVHGFPLAGHGLVLRVDAQGRLRSAHGAVSAAAATLPPPRITPEGAVERGLAAAGLSRGELRGEPLVEPVARLLADGPHLIHRVEVVRGLIPLALEVDAHDGALLAVVEDTVHGGTLVWDGEALPFATGTGKGQAFKSLAGATKAVAGASPMSQVILDDLLPGLADKGTLTGRFAQVLDATGAQVFSPTLDFTFDPFDPGVVGSLSAYQLFDHANTYQWLTRMGGFVLKRLGAFAGDTTALAFVNYDDQGEGYINAFYSSGDPDGPGGYGPGYFVFGEFGELTGDPMDDLSRDPSVVCHEYVHLVVDKEGVALGEAPIDTPPRAVNEALADYAAASFLKDPRVGRAFVAHADELELDVETLRDLSEERTLAADLWVLVGDGGLPEEHEAGVIFGAALWRARSALKPVATDRLVLGQLDALPLGTAEVGYPVVDPANAEDAYHAFFFACFEALADALIADGGTKGPVLAGRLLGAFLAHGITGSRDDNVRLLDAADGLKLACASAFLDGDGEHVVDLDLAAGQTLSVVVKGQQGTLVDFALDDEPGELEPTKPKKVNAAGTKAAQVKIGVVVGRAYRLTITNPDTGGGRYKLLVKVTG